MTMTRSRKVEKAAASRRDEIHAALPDLEGAYSEADLNEFTEMALADIDKASALMANASPATKRYAEVLSVAIAAQAHHRQARAWLAMAFERITSLERQLTDAKSLQRKSLDSRFSLDDLQVEQVDERNITLKLARGDDEASFTLKFPVVVSRGLWNERAVYECGDGVSYGGSWWIARGDNPGKPGVDEGWRLAVKKGRDGKDAGK